MRLYISILGLGLAGLLLAPGATVQSTGMTALEAAATYPAARMLRTSSAPLQSGGAEILERACTACHDLGGVDEFASSGEDATRDLVTTMIAYGAPVAEDEVDILVAHILTNYGQEETAFDEDAGVALLNSKCTTCHDLTGIERGQYPPDEWVDTVDRMLGYGLALTEEEYGLILTTLGTAPGASPAGTQAEGEADDGGGAGDAGTAAFDEVAATELVNAKCTTCHDLTSIGERGTYPPEEWAETVDRMIGYGLALTEEEYDTILTYLGTPPGEAPGAEAGAGPAADAAPAFDEAAATELVNAKCTTCHDLTSIGERGTYPPEEWAETVDRMIGYGLALTEEEYDTILTYLGTPPGDAPGAEAGAGDGGYDVAEAEMLLNASCTTCHDLTAITSNPGTFTETQFRDTIIRMTGYGLAISEEQIDTLVRYLTETYGAE